MGLSTAVRMRVDVEELKARDCVGRSCRVGEDGDSEIRQRENKVHSHIFSRTHALCPVMCS